MCRMSKPSCRTLSVETVLSTPLPPASPFMLANARSNLVPEYFCGVCDPIAIEGQGRHAGQATATVRVSRPRRPAYHTHDHARAALDAEHRGAGVPCACTKTRFIAPGRGIIKADLQSSWPPGRDQIRDAHGSTGLAVAARRDARTRDRECIARRD